MPNESEDFNRAAVDESQAAMSQQPYEPTYARPAPPPGPPPAHSVANRPDYEAVADDSSYQRNKANAGSNTVTFDLEKMSRHLHPDDEKVRDE